MNSNDDVKKGTLTLEDGSNVSFDATITVQDNFLDKKYFEYLKTSFKSRVYLEYVSCFRASAKE